MRIDPTHYIWWLLSRSAGIVALTLVSFSVLLGLTMATKIVQRPGLGRKLARLHEHLALVALSAMVVHGATLLGDPWLHVGVKGVLVPFAMGYRTLYTGLGMVAAYLAAVLGLSFYARRRIGARLWRKLHRATALVWVLGVVHTLGAGSDASTIWLRVVMLVTGAPIVFLLLVRIFDRRPAAVRAPAPARGSAAAGFSGAAEAPLPIAAPAAMATAPPRLEHRLHARDDHARRTRPRPVVAEETL